MATNGERFDPVNKPQVEGFEGIEFDYGTVEPFPVQISFAEGYELPVEQEEPLTFVPKSLIEKGDK